MRITLFAFAVLLACAGEGLARSDLPQAEPKAGERTLYIVEFEEPPLASFRGEAATPGAKFAGLKATSPVVTGARRLDVEAPASVAYRAALTQWREDRLLAAGARFGRVLEPDFVYDVVANGVALALEPAEAAALEKLDGVRSVTPDFVQRPMTDAGPQWIGAETVWNGVGGSRRGEGAVVGIVDSGINRTHPSFAALGPVDGHSHTNPRNRFYGRCAELLNAGDCNNKLIGIYDFTTCTGTDTGCDDREPNTGLDPDGHGTHVASTAAGNALNMSLSLPTGAVTRRISGVAPHANLISYKACEQEEDCRGTWLIRALDQAVADGVDVINYSIGGGATNPWTRSDGVAMLNAREAGTVVVVSAGNDGPGVSTVSGPADAPWVIAVANATHDRGIVNRLVDLVGGASAPPSGGVLVGASNTSGYGPRALVIDPQFPGCSQGEDLDSPPSGASNPWPPNRFNGEIVVCERGVQARVAKSNNVRLAGGGGMVLVNTAIEGESVVADSHSIPSTHLGYTAGAALKAWLSTGSGHQGRIEGVQIRNEASLADVLSASSGRGPSPTATGVLKPDITAPGSTILAAAGTGTGGVFLSGTSMASPHVAGAAALLAATRPSWTPSQIESALLTTARASVRRQDAVTAAGPFDAGSGAADVSKAINAGLYLNITPNEFRNANPSSGGQPRNLNRPSLAHENCFETCTLSRRVTDMGAGGSWRVEFVLPDGATATATPDTLTLAAGQSATVNFAFDLRDARFPGSWVEGRVRFVRTGGSAAPNAELPLALFASPGSLPATMALNGKGESGHADVLMGDLVALPQADFQTTSLGPARRTEQTLVQDPTRDNRYDNFVTGVFYETVQVPAAPAGSAPFLFSAETSSPTAYDVDLFVGEDLDGDGAPDENEELCESTSPRDREVCEITVAPGSAPRTFWILVQNWDAGLQGSGDTAVASDLVRLDTRVIPLDFGQSAHLTATGPGRTPSRAGFPLRLAWDDPTLLPGERRAGLLRIGASKAYPGRVGTLRVEVSRDTDAESSPAVLDPDGGVRRMRLAAGAAQDRLFLDVPATASTLTVESSGSGEVDLYLARAASASSPVIDPAPARAQAAASATGPGATHTLSVTGAALQPGRWYVTPVNAGGAAATFDLKVSLQYGVARPEPRYGAFYNPARSGSGLFLFPAGQGGLWGLAWYTYLQDGTPTWYLGVADKAPSGKGVWRVPIQRFSWDGSAATGVDVGIAQLSFVDADRFNFSFDLDGQSGHEPMVFIDGGSCAQLNGAPAKLTGLWYSPARSGTGYSINAYPGLESNGAYFYDALGVARWVLGQASPFGVATMTLAQRDGFCPLCAYKAPVASEVGTLTRSYTNDSSGTIRIDLQLKPPMSGTWNIDLPMLRLSDGLPCQ